MSGTSQKRGALTPPASSGGRTKWGANEVGGDRAGVNEVEGERSGGAKGPVLGGKAQPPSTGSPAGGDSPPPHFVQKKYGGLSPPTSLHSRKGVTSGGIRPPLRSFLFFYFVGGAIAPRRAAGAWRLSLGAKHRAFGSSPTSFIAPPKPPHFVFPNSFTIVPPTTVPPAIGTL